MTISVNFSVTGRSAALGSLEGEVRRAVSCRLPSKLSDSDLAVVKKDCEVLRQIVETNPRSLSDILTAAESGDFDQARHLAETAGFTEAAFKDKGGGIWLAVAIGVAILLYSQEAH